MGQNRDIPSDENFRRASEAIRKRSRGLSEIRDEILNKFRGSVIHEFFIFDLSEKSFKAFVFYNTNKQLEESDNTEFAEELQETIFELLEKFGRGKREDIDLKLEFDSHENVNQLFGGDYFTRLR